MNWKDMIAGVFLILLGGFLLFSGYSLATNGTDYHYEYTVKAEQVNEDEMVDGAIAYKNVSEAEQAVLFDAFKKSDHFLGGAEAYVYTDEPIENVSNEWRVIEIQGVPILVAIQGPVQESTPSESFELAVVFFGIPLGLILLLLSFEAFAKGLED